MSETDVGIVMLILFSWVMIGATFYFADRQANKKGLTKTNNCVILPEQLNNRGNYK